ncbi:MAG: peptidase domain-containing ABC transporter, partial [Rivularia sp. ALOHA_DT_140]|nr:peptidase domain-containing ABC transporter [Rivularia sp. ALOHA_DT_140]
VRGCLNQLESQVSPWIAHYQGNHYIVVWLIKNKSVMISDPAIGKLWVPLLEFEEKFTGYALLLYPTEKFFTNQNEKISFKRFYRFFANNRLLFAAIIFISIALGILGIVPAILAQTLIDIVTSTNNFDSINIFAFGFLVFGFGRIVLTAMRQYLVDNLSNRLNISLIGDFMSHILQLPLSFFTSRRAADIISKIQENPKIHRFLTRKAITTVLDGLMSIICFGLMAYYSLKLTLVVITFLWIVMGFLVVGNLFLKQIRRQYAFDSKEQNSVIVEIITGITTIKTENAENSLRSRWEEYFTQMVKTQKQGQNLTNIFQQANSLINHLGTTMVLWFGTQMVINSQISIGEFIAFNMLIGNTINPILALVKLWNEFPEILTSIEKLDDVLASETEAKIQKALTVLPSIRGEVRFENVSFGDTASIAEGNSQQGDILQNISFCVKQGQTIAIVGDNDSSKNALVKLLSGLYHPNKGRILIDGLDINQVTPDSLRSQLGVISQEFFLFSGTILENITLYNRNFSLEKVQSAAKRAGAHAFIEKLPLGYSTILGEGGIRLDAKQQRKLAIARALFKNPRILIIDEANNSLDSLCEYQFQQNLTCDNVAVIDTSFIKNTTFIVTPSLSSIHKADNILVFYRGILVDQGTHEELMTRSTIYPSLIQQQVDM